MPQRYSITMIILLFLTLFFSICSSVRAATDNSFGTVVEDFGKTCLEDTEGILTAPGQWEREQWLKSAIIAGTTLLLLESDQSVREYFQEHRTGFSDNLSGVMDKLGNISYLAPALGMWYLYGRAVKNSKAQETALVSLESLMIAGGLTGVIKVAFHRSRPYTAAGARDFNGPAFSWEDEQLSFPSMHSAAAFAVATVVADSYQDRPWVPVVSFTTASLVAL
ncbi:MAG TPA: phosphatase PAP2 family protein, partial [Bacillota bacterium]|nr:phosphatase PAP2 family protein [Bacillota bacterium]